MHPHPGVGCDRPPAGVGGTASGGDTDQRDGVYAVLHMAVV